jgi:hypothetical protein
MHYDKTQKEKELKTYYETPNSGYLTTKFHTFLYAVNYTKWALRA